jgi:hypothetical protein
MELTQAIGRGTIAPTLSRYACLWSISSTSKT